MAAVAQPLWFQGQYADAETGLHYNRHRYYSPGEGRFVTQDPIRLASGTNVAAYAPNPVAWVDPLGLAPCEFVNPEHEPNFDKARQKAFERAGMTNPEDVQFSKVDPGTGTVVEFKGPNGAKVAYDSPHAEPGPGHDQPHVGWQTGGKRGSGGTQRGN